MKQAMGDLTSGIVVLVAIGILIAFFYYTLWPILKQNFDAESQCSKAICESCPTSDCEYVRCHLKDKPSEFFECVYKG